MGKMTHGKDVRTYKLSLLLKYPRLVERLFQDADRQLSSPFDRDKFVSLYSSVYSEGWLVASKPVVWQDGTWHWADQHAHGRVVFLSDTIRIDADVPLVTEDGHRLLILRSKTTEDIRNWWNQPRFHELQLGGKHATTR